jgi:hypothetical protein
MTSGVATVMMADMDPELEAFISLFPPADLTDRPPRASTWPAEVVDIEEHGERPLALLIMREDECLEDPTGGYVESGPR